MEPSDEEQRNVDSVVKVPLVNEPANLSMPWDRWTRWQVWDTVDSGDPFVDVAIGDRLVSCHWTHRRAERRRARYISNHLRHCKDDPECGAEKSFHYVVRRKESMMWRRYVTPDMIKIIFIGLFGTVFLLIDWGLLSLIDVTVSRANSTSGHTRVSWIAMTILLSGVQLGYSVTFIVLCVKFLLKSFKREES